jgi:DNA-binding MarR family transcriptional regulator/N-acetylglutamate synthase-like GNAT family acetyltransferase
MPRPSFVPEPPSASATVAAPPVAVSPIAPPAAIPPVAVSLMAVPPVAVPPVAVPPVAVATTLDEAIETVRGFNRVYTRCIGLLDHEFLGSEFTLSEARVLYELAKQTDFIASVLARVLGIDMGYLSRMLGQFARKRLIKRTRSTADGRRVLVQLTSKGRRALEALDQAARDQIADLIMPFSEARREDLLAAMRSIRRILAPYESEKPYLVRPVRLDDLRTIIERQGALYSQEYGWDGSYRELVAEILGNFAKSFDPGREAGWVAECQGTLVGSVFVMWSSGSVAQLRLLYVEPTARGLGIGHRLVQECIEFARAKGYQEIRLWTNDVLVSARRIYEEAGFTLTEEKEQRKFGRDLVSQWWSLSL